MRRNMHEAIFGVILQTLREMGETADEVAETLSKAGIQGRPCIDKDNPILIYLNKVLPEKLQSNGLGSNLTPNVLCVATHHLKYTIFPDEEPTLFIVSDAISNFQLRFSGGLFDHILMDGGRGN